MTEDAVKLWDELRREARFLENQIDIKLVSFNKVGADSALSGVADRESDIALSFGFCRIMDESSLSKDISVLLNRFCEVLEKMDELSPQNSSLSTPTRIHILNRHRDILQDYSVEFKKTQKKMLKLKIRKEREELLPEDAGIKKVTDSNKDALNRRLDLYMKERDHLVNSERMVNEQIEIAMDTKEGLVSQRDVVNKIQSRMMELISRYPTLNNLIRKANMKKRKDSIIIGSVIGISTYLLIYSGFYG